jgi:uncharacterized protein YjeT (DUF2065 family)
VALPVLDEARMRQALFVLACVQLFLGLFLVIAPGTFVDKLANYGTGADDHFLRDVGTFYLAMGAALLLAVRRPSWRVPVLFLVTLQYALHTINHLIDIGNTDPGWLGPFNFLSLLLLTIVTGWVLGGAARLGHR